MSDFLTRRNGTWHFVRRVPVEFAAFVHAFTEPGAIVFIDVEGRLAALRNDEVFAEANAIRRKLDTAPGNVLNEKVDLVERRFSEARRIEAAASLLGELSHLAIEGAVRGDRANALLAKNASEILARSTAVIVVSFVVPGEMDHEAGNVLAARECNMSRHECVPS